MRHAYVLLLLLGCAPEATTVAGADATRVSPDAALADAAARPDATARLDAAARPDAAPDANAADAVTPDATPAASDCLATVRVGSLEIFAYEASRPDADAHGPGTDGTRACSRAGVLPWTEVTPAEAAAACAAQGFHLCTDAEWQGACGGDRGWIFPYGNAHQPGVCNDHVSGTGALQPTGAEPRCRTPEGVYDLSGNVWELTADGSRRGASFRVEAVTYMVDAARCDVFYFAPESYASDDAGFRCCR